MVGIDSRLAMSFVRHLTRNRGGETLVKFLENNNFHFHSYRFGGRRFILPLFALLLAKLTIII